MRFFIATNALKPCNQVHLIEYKDDTSSVSCRIFEHSFGEVWKLNANPHNKYEIITCYNEVTANGTKNRAILLRYSDNTKQEQNAEFLGWDHVQQLKLDKFGEKIKTIEFNPQHEQLLACVVDSKIVAYDRVAQQTQEFAKVTSNTSSSKHINPFTAGKWSHHHQGNLFVALHDTHIKAFDSRTNHGCAWRIEDAHNQLVRDIDCNPNKQCHFLTGGDDGFIKIWDSRMSKLPVFARNDHAHWVWCVRYNTFHDQLVLSSSSDCKVLLTCAASASSEAEAQLQMHSVNDVSDTNNKYLPDGLLQTFDHHEDSVYCVEWSNVDPWMFASLSYDGRLLLYKVPKHYKYEIIL